MKKTPINILFFASFNTRAQSIGVVKEGLDTETIDQATEELESKIDRIGDIFEQNITKVDNLVGKIGFEVIVGMIFAVINFGSVYWILCKKQKERIEQLIKPKEESFT